MNLWQKLIMRRLYNEQHSEEVKAVAVQQRNLLKKHQQQIKMSHQQIVMILLKALKKRMVESKASRLIRKMMPINQM